MKQRSRFSEVLRYLLVGAWNTLFGYGLFALFTHLLRRIPYGYVIALVIANLIAISVAFLGYKWFVFRTRGQYLREWLRTMSVYGAGMLLNAALLPLFTELLRHKTSLGVRSPYVAQAFLAVFIVALSYVGHRHFTFRRKPSVPAETPPYANQELR